MMKSEKNCIVVLTNCEYSVFSLSKMKEIDKRNGTTGSSIETTMSLIKAFLMQKIPILESAVEAIEPSATNYWHFMAYTLPTILSNRHNANFFLVAEITSYMSQYMSLLGIEINRLIAIRNNPIFTNRLILSGSELPCRDNKYDPYSGLELIAEELKQYKSQQITNNRVFVDRCSSNNGSIYRKIYPESTWRRFIANMGFRIVFLESMTVHEQIRIFSEAEVIMAMHGAALTNCIYMREGATVIELMHKEGVENGGYLDMFLTITYVMKINFFRIPCDPLLAKEEELKIQKFTGNYSTNPLPVKHTANLEARIIDILRKIS